MQLSSERQLPLLGKLLCIAAAAVLLVLGVAGLVLPIIPGLLFLGLALWLLTKVSRRFAALLDDSPHMARHIKAPMGFLRRTRGLSVSQKAKLAAWVSAKMILQGLRAVPALFQGNRSR